MKNKNAKDRGFFSIWVNKHFSLVVVSDYRMLVGEVTQKASGDSLSLILPQWPMGSPDSTLPSLSTVGTLLLFTPVRGVSLVLQIYFGFLVSSLLYLKFEILMATYALSDFYTLRSISTAL